MKEGNIMPAKTASAKTVAVQLAIEEVSVKNKDSLEKIVTEELWKIEKGLAVIGCEVPVDDNRMVDILCHDYNGQLVALMLDVTEDDAILFNGLHTLTEVNRVKHMLRYFNKDNKINDREPSRLILLAPSFSKNLLTIASGITNVKISLYSWEYLQFGENKALRVTPIVLSETKNRK
jgi:RecB family endonuclease NucS